MFRYCFAVKKHHLLIMTSCVLAILFAPNIQPAWAHGFGMGGGHMASPGGGMMPPGPMPPGGNINPGGGPNGPMGPGGHYPGRGSAGGPGGAVGPPRGGAPYPGYGAYGRGNPWWGESYMDGWYMMPWMMAGGRSNANDSSGGDNNNSNGSNNNNQSSRPSQGYGSAYNGYDYGQYVPPMGHVMPPRSDPGSDGNAMFNCHDGYFYDSLTEKCEKQQQ